MRISLTPDEVDTLRRTLDYACTQIEEELTPLNNTRAFCLRLARSKVGALRAKIFPTERAK